MKRFWIMLGVTVMVLAVAAPAAADKPTPTNYDEPDIVETNPCTGADQTLFVTFEGHEHLDHPNNYVRTGVLTGTSSDGYVMDHGREKLVVGQHTAVLTFHGMWSNAEGSKYKTNAVLVENLDTGEWRWDIRSKCIRH